LSENITLKVNDKGNKNGEVFRPIHYLGSKLRILDFIEKTIDELDPNMGKVCDLFSGSGSVSFKLSKTRPVLSVDIQEYSKVICSSLLQPVKIEKGYLDDFISRINDSDNNIELFEAVKSLIDYETLSILDALNHIELGKLCEILEDGSLISYEITKKGRKSKLGTLISQSIEELKKQDLLNKKSLAIRYFGGIYFSYKQSFQIDIILEEISNSPKEYQELLLAALLSSASECVNTVGKQFAQPIRPRKTNGDIKKSIGTMVFKDRSLDVFEVYAKWLKKYNSLPDNAYDNEVLKVDYSIALENLPKDTTVVYADPPYTREHYSRFYHVLETIALRDTPSISTMVLRGETLLSRGLYREDRHQSPFCIRSTAPKAFELIFSKVSAFGAKLVLSYSPYDESNGSHPRVITMNKLTEIAQKYYQNVTIVSPGNFVHSKLTNSAKHLDASDTAEVLIICQN
jgi:adenine-specific DNA methylase